MGLAGAEARARLSDLVRASGLAVALAAYGLFSSPTPGRIGLDEIAIAGGLMLAVGPVRPLLLGTGYLLADPRARLHEVVGTVSFLYLLWVPLLRAAFLGRAADDVVRDVVPLIYLFLPVLLVPNLECGRQWLGRLLVWGMAAVGVLYALRWWWPGMAFRSVGRTVMPEGDLYLLNSPAVLFAAVWLPLAAVRLLERAEGRRDSRRGALVLRAVSALALLGAGAVAGAALAGVVHRAALALATVAFAWFAVSQVRRTPLLLAALLAVGAVLGMMSGGAVLGTVGQVLEKTEAYGLNARSAEAVTVVGQVGRSWGSLLFGEGWGALVRNPAVGEMWVSYTHTFATYMLVKTGLVGCLAAFAYLASLVPPMLRLVRSNVPLAASLLPPLGLGLLAHTSFKYLCFGLLLSIIVLASGRDRGMR